MERCFDTVQKESADKAIEERMCEWEKGRRGEEEKRREGNSAQLSILSGEKNKLLDKEKLNE